MAQEKSKTLTDLSDMSAEELSSALSEHETKLAALASRLTGGTFSGLDEIKDPEFAQWTNSMIQLVGEFVTRCQKLTNEMEDDGLDVFLVEDEMFRFFAVPGKTPDSLKNSGLPLVRKKVVRFNDETNEPEIEECTFFGLSSYMFKELGIDSPSAVVSLGTPIATNEEVTLH